MRIVTSLLVFLLVWETIARSGLFPGPLFPPPTVVAKAAFQMTVDHSSWPRTFNWVPEVWRSGLLLDASVSLERALVGWAVGSVLGSIVGLLTGRLAVLSSYVTPVIQIFRPLPPVAIIPIIIVWFGIGDFSKLFSIAFAVFFPVWINAHLGAEKIPPSFIWGAQSLNASKSSIFRSVVLPGSLPFIAAGLRNGIAVAFVMVYVSELAGASSGVGYQINTSYLAYRVDRMFAALIVLGGLGALSDIALTRGLSAAFPWLKYASQK